MRGSYKAGLLVVGIMLVLVQSAPAFHVTSFTVDPSGPLLPETPVIATGKIDFTPSPGETFDSRHDLRFNTSLENAKWYWVPSEKGVVTPVTTPHPARIPLPYPPFHYPENENVIMKFTLLGKAPAVNKTTNITILWIQEVDEYGIPITGLSFRENMTIVNSCDCTDPVPLADAELEGFRNHIDEMTALSIDTSPAEEKYSEACQKIKSAANRSSNQYILIFTDIDDARKAIDDGEVLLEKARAEKAIATAQGRLNQADEIIGWFKGNKSTAMDYRLESFVAERDEAAQFLSSATREMQSGNYSLAHSDAEQAFLKANASYSNASVRQLTLLTSSICNPCNYSLLERYRPFFVPAGVVSIACIIFAVIWWRKYRR